MTIKGVKNLLSSRNRLNLDEMTNPNISDLSNNKNKIFNKIKRINEIVKELKKLDSELYKNNQLYQFAKADLDVLKYEYEKSQFGHGSITDIEKKYFSLTDNVNKYFLIRQNSESKIETMKIQEREIRKEIDEINIVIKIIKSIR